MIVFLASGLLEKRYPISPYVLLGGLGIALTGVALAILYLSAALKGDRLMASEEARRWPQVNDGAERPDATRADSVCSDGGNPIE